MSPGPRESASTEFEPEPLGRWLWCVVALVVAGVGLRAWRALLAGLPMRIDEVRVAVNVQARTYAELALPLDHQQGAPVGFLWLCKAAVQALGDHDAAYRVVPMLAGVGVVVLTPLLARRVVGRPGVVFATALVALAPWAVQYSSDLKQYSMDALATAGVLLAALYALGPRATWRSRAAFAGVGALAIVCSHAAVFVAAAAGLTLGAAALCRKAWRGVAQLLGVALAWGAAFAVLWRINLQHISGRGDLVDYWAQDFMPLPPTTAGQWGWYARAPIEWLNTSGFYFNPVVGVLAVLGLWALRRRPAIAGLLLGPVALTLAASAAQQYPFANRMIAFLLPATALVLAAGFETAVRRSAGRAATESPQETGRRKTRRRLSPESAAAALVVACFVITFPFSRIARPWTGGRFDLVEPIAVIEARQAEGDLVVVGSALWWPYTQWYAPRVGLPTRHDPQRFVCRQNPRDVDDDDADQLRTTLRQAAADGRRVWVLAADGIWMGHHPTWPTLGDLHDTRAPTRKVLEELGTIQAQHDGANVSVYLWVPDEGENAQ